MPEDHERLLRRLEERVGRTVNNRGHFARLLEEAVAEARALVPEDESWQRTYILGEFRPDERQRVRDEYAVRRAEQRARESYNISPIEAAREDLELAELQDRVQQQMMTAYQVPTHVLVDAETREEVQPRDPLDQRFVRGSFSTFEVQDGADAMAYAMRQHTHPVREPRRSTSPAQPRREGPQAPRFQPGRVIDLDEG